MMRAFFLRVCRLLACCVVTFTAAATEIEVIDDSGRAVLLKAPARRVIALSPHATELIFAAGGGDKLVATTVGSDYPIQALALPKLDDRQPFNRSVIAAFKPDLIFGWLPAELESLEALNIPVFISTPGSLIEIADSVETFGVLLGTAGVAHGRAEALRHKLDALAQASAKKRVVRVLLQTETDPDSGLTGEHLLSEVIALCGGRNVLTESASGAPKLTTAAQLVAAAPEMVLIARTGAGTTPVVDRAGVTHWQNAGLPAARLGRVFMMEHAALFRPGPRLLEAAEPLCALIEQIR